MRTRLFAFSSVLCLLSLTLSGCATHTTPEATVANPADYYWHLTHIHNRQATPVEARTQLRFQDGQVHVSGLCNSVGGSAVFTGEQLHIDHLRSTMKACNSTELMTHERVFSSLLADVRTWSVETQPDHPVLALTLASGGKLYLHGEPTPEKRYGNTGETLFLEIQPQKVTCHHPLIADYQCLQVRRITYDERGLKSHTGDWEYFYDTIENYTHREDTRVVLRLKRYTIANPPADGSRYAYIHDLTVEQEWVNP